MKFLRVGERLINTRNISDIFIMENTDSNKFRVFVEYKRYDYFFDKERICLEVYYESDSKEESLKKLDELEEKLNF